MADTVTVLAADLRAAVAHLRRLTGTAHRPMVERLAAAVAQFDTPDLFSQPVEPSRPIEEAHLPPMHGAPTTQRMRAAAFPRSGTLRARIVALIHESDIGGRTDDELEQITGKAHQSVSACRNGLAADGWLEAAVHGNGMPRMRRNRYDNMAQVWVATDAAKARL